MNYNDFDQDITLFRGDSDLVVDVEEPAVLVITSMEQYNEIDKVVAEMKANKEYHNPNYLTLLTALEAYYDLMGMED